MKITNGTYTVGGFGKAPRAQVTIARVDSQIVITKNGKKIGDFLATDFTVLTYAQFIDEHPDFPQWANEFYGERVTNSMISELYDTLSTFA